MSPRPARDLDLRRDQIILRRAHHRRVRRLGRRYDAPPRRDAVGATQPVLYSAFDGRQALIDAVAVNGFAELAATLEAVDTSPIARMHAYLDFAAAHPRVYEAMFSLPSGLAFASEDAPEPLHRAFWASSKHSPVRPAPERRSPGRRCTAWPPFRRAGACGRPRRGAYRTRPPHAHPTREPLMSTLIEIRAPGV